MGRTGRKSLIETVNSFSLKNLSIISDYTCFLLVNFWYNWAELDWYIKDLSKSNSIGINVLKTQNETVQYQWELVCLDLDQVCETSNNWVLGSHMG